MFKTKGFWILVFSEEDLETLPSVASTSSHWSEPLDPGHCVPITESHPHCFLLFLTFWTTVVWVEYQRENTSISKYSEGGSSQEPLLEIQLCSHWKKLLGLLSLSWKKKKKKIKSMAQLRKYYTLLQKFSWEASEEFHLILPWCCLLFHFSKHYPKVLTLPMCHSHFLLMAEWEEFFPPVRNCQGKQLMSISNEDNP